MNAIATNRRNFLKLALAGGGALTIPGLISSCASSTTNSTSSGGSSGGGFTLPKDINANWPKITSKEVVLSGFGGETYQTRHRLIFDPFTKLSGATVVDAPWDYGKFLNMVDSASPEWDSIDFDGYSTVALVESGQAPAKLADWVRRCDAVDKAYQDYAAGSYAYSVVMGWSSSLKGTPETWADFFDTKKFPGKRAFPKSIYAGTVEIALMADGANKDDLYPLDFDRAFKKLDEIKSDLVFYDSYAQGQQLMVQGSATMMATANSRMIQLQNQGRGKFTYNQAVLYPWGAFPVTLHAQHADATNAMIDTMSHPAVQAEIARTLYLGPIVSDAFNMLTKDELALQPNSPDNRAKAAVLNTKVAASQDPEYVKRFFAWVGQ